MRNIYYKNDWVVLMCSGSVLVVGRSKNGRHSVPVHFDRQRHLTLFALMPFTHIACINSVDFCAPRNISDNWSLILMQILYSCTISIHPCTYPLMLFWCHINPRKKQPQTPSPTLYRSFSLINSQFIRISFKHLLDNWLSFHAQITIHRFCFLLNLI